MGYASARDMAEQTDLRTAIAWHLRGNLYPPVPLVMVETCEQAILSVLDNEAKKMLPLPDGVLYRGEPFASAAAVVEGHHLEAFVDSMIEFE